MDDYWSLSWSFRSHSAYVPCNLETSRSLQTARWLCSLQTARPPFQWTTCTCVLWRDNFKENRQNCHDFLVLYCLRNWEVISVVENLVRHNNRSFRANKLVIVSPNYKQENEYWPLSKRQRLFSFRLGSFVKKLSLAENLRFRWNFEKECDHAVCRLRTMQSADCILSPMQSADCAGSQIACNTYILLNAIAACCIRLLISTGIGTSMEISNSTFNSTRPLFT